MKRKPIALTIAGVLALGSGAALQAKNHGHEGGKRHGKMGKFALEHVTKELDLTPQQQAQVAPIIDQAKPQIRAIHQEAMQKTHTVMQASVAQIRPLLTPEQQQKLDRLQQAHEKMREAMRELHDAKS